MCVLFLQKNIQHVYFSDFVFSTIMYLLSLLDSQDSIRHNLFQMEATFLLIALLLMSVFKTNLHLP